MDLTEAIRRSATLPALTLEDMSPAMRRKGRLEIDADADIVAFDLTIVSDQATYTDSCRVSTGMRHVLVNGVPLIRDGRLDTTVLPGQRGGAGAPPPAASPAPREAGARRHHGSTRRRDH
jgi:N-acyl-D-aspartate/D-glutamate deacylase